MPTRHNPSLEGFNPHPSKPGYPHNHQHSNAIASNRAMAFAMTNTLTPKSAANTSKRLHPMGPSHAIETPARTRQPPPKIIQIQADRVASDKQISTTNPRRDAFTYSTKPCYTSPPLQVYALDIISTPTNQTKNIQRKWRPGTIPDAIFMLPSALLEYPYTKAPHQAVQPSRKPT